MEFTPTPFRQTLHGCFTLPTTCVIPVPKDSHITLVLSSFIFSFISSPLPLYMGTSSLICQLSGIASSFAILLQILVSQSTACSPAAHEHGLSSTWSKISTLSSSQTKCGQRGMVLMGGQVDELHMVEQHQLSSNNSKVEMAWWSGPVS